MHINIFSFKAYTVVGYVCFCGLRNKTEDTKVKTEYTASDPQINCPHSSHPISSLWQMTLNESCEFVHGNWSSHEAVLNLHENLDLLAQVAGGEPLMFEALIGDLNLHYLLLWQTTVYGTTWSCFCNQRHEHQ